MDKLWKILDFDIELIYSDKESLINYLETEKKDFIPKITLE